jgi:oligoendopeptidase F
MIQTREQVPQSDCWNVEALYPSFADWEADYKKYFSAQKTPRWPELRQFQGQLSKGPQTVKECLEFLFTTQRTIEKLYTYAHLRNDEEIANDKHKTAYQKMMAIYHEFAQEASWFEPELLSLPADAIDRILNAPEIEPYRFYLEKIVRLRDHTLSPENEMLMALSGKALQTAHKAFSAINDADFTFGSVKDSEGNDREISHANYGLYIREHDRVLRENAFRQYHTHYKSYENTLAELLAGQTEAHVFNARARRYDSCLHAALFPKNIDTQVYHSLVQAVNDNLGALHKYFALRKQVMGVKELHLYDMYVPLTSEIEITMGFDQAINRVGDSVAPLGEEYQNLLRQGLSSERWCDRYENKNKRSGAYSSGCYDSMPYILMNYKDKLRDVFTLAHEAGHSMHSLLSHKNQPYHYGDYPIFLAEVASTFNEDLLTRLLIKNAKSREEKIFLINQQIEDIRATLFRQTMFAEFELRIHTLSESNTPLTPALLNTEFMELNQKYFGSATTIDSEIAVEWARIPHFYYNFYVYQYATGISAALALSERVNEGGTKERDAYLSFLKGGSSRYPIELLKTAGVDMTTPAPVEAAIKKFSRLVDQLEELLALNPSKC